MATTLSAIGPHRAAGLGVGGKRQLSRSAAYESNGAGATGAGEGADAIARLKEANGDSRGVVLLSPRESPGSPTSGRISNRNSDMCVEKR